MRKSKRKMGWSKKEPQLSNNNINNKTPTAGTSDRKSKNPASREKREKEKGEAGQSTEHQLGRPTGQTAKGLRPGYALGGKEKS